MIVPMKKVTILCLEQDKTVALEQLRGLGLMQIAQDARPDTGDVNGLIRAVADAERAFSLIQTSCGKGKTSDSDVTDGAAIVKRVLALADSRASVQKALDSLRRDRDRLEPWGEFSRETLASLREKGVFVTLCVSQPAIFEARLAGRDLKPFPAGSTAEVVFRDKSQVCYALIGTDDPGHAVADAVQLPDSSLSEVLGRIRQAEDTLLDIDRETVSFRAVLAKVRAYHEEQSAKLEFAEARDGMKSAGPLSYLSGYVPLTEVQKLRDGALEYGWALLIGDPAPDDDRVPTYIRKPKFLSVMDPLFDFIGIQPGYRENDVTVFFLFFFPIFFGMILGDAGYAVLFLATAFVCKWIFRGKESARLPLNLFILLSLFALIWGWLNGSWLGIPEEYLPRFMRGWSFITDPQNSPLAQKLVARLHLIQPDMSDLQIKAVWDGLPNKFVQYFCFLLAGLQLGAARLFKFFDEIPHTWRAFGHLGWACVIVANFFMATSLIVFPGTFPTTLGFTLYGAGFALVVVTITGVAAMNLPFAITGSFVDVLSYIRLFAVGLSGSYIAVNFNKMGVMLLNALPDQLVVIGFVLLIVVALFGHILNIALGFLGVMVHAIRLNTLEFSNHIEMQWTGIKFHPFSAPEKQVLNKNK